MHLRKGTGILGVVGTSIVICCGPSNPGEGSSKLKCCAILCIIAAVFHLIGLILMIVVYALAYAEAEKWWRGGYAVYTGLLVIIIIDGLISIGAGVLEVVCAVKCMQASTVLAIPYEGNQVATATGVATNAVVATAVVATAAPPAFVFASEAFSASSSSWNSRRFPVSSWRTGSVDSFIGGGVS